MSVSGSVFSLVAFAFSLAFATQTFHGTVLVDRWKPAYTLTISGEETLFPDLFRCQAYFSEALHPNYTPGT